MKHRIIFKIFFFLTLLTLFCCTDDYLYTNKATDRSDQETVEELRNHFENNASSLLQVDLKGKAVNRVTHNSPNISPDWEKARVWEAYKNVYVEVPLKGFGIYRYGIVHANKNYWHKPYLAKSFLILMENKSTKSVNYFIATTLIDSRGRYRPNEEEQYYVGNGDFNGLLIFSHVDGHFIKGFHLHDGHSHPIYVGPTREKPIKQNQNSTAPTTYTLTLSSTLSRYAFDESEGGEGGSTGNYIYCALCGKLYDITLENGCPNGCEVEINPDPTPDPFPDTDWEDPWITCPYCHLPYHVSDGGCACGGASSLCPDCGKNPCQCAPDVCERCGSPSCPGPWFCSQHDCTGSKCPVCGGYKGLNNSNCPTCTCKEEEPKDDTVWSGDPLLDKLKREMLKLGFEVKKTVFKWGRNGCKANAQVNSDGSISFCPQFEQWSFEDQIAICAHECYHVKMEHIINNEQIQTLDTPIQLFPPQDIIDYYTQIYEKDAKELEFNEKESIENYITLSLESEFKIYTILSPQHNKNEIETYTWEIKMFPNVTPLYDSMRNAEFWKFKQRYIISLQYHKY